MGRVQGREDFLGAVCGLGECRAPVFGVVVGRLRAGLWKGVAAACLFEVPHRCEEKPRKLLDLRGARGWTYRDGPVFIVL